MPGVAELARLVFGLDVRIGYPEAGSAFLLTEGTDFIGHSGQRPLCAFDGDVEELNLLM